MNTIHPMYAEVARLGINQRLRDADEERRRRLARHIGTSTRRSSNARLRQTASQ